MNRNTKVQHIGSSHTIGNTLLTAVFRPILGMRIKSVVDSPIIEERGFVWIGTWQLVKDLGGNNWHELVDENWQCKTCGKAHKYPYSHTCKND